MEWKFFGGVTFSGTRNTVYLVLGCEKKNCLWSSRIPQKQQPASKGKKQPSLQCCWTSAEAFLFLCFHCNYNHKPPPQSCACSDWNGRGKHAVKRTNFETSHNDWTAENPASCTHLLLTPSRCCFYMAKRPAASLAFFFFFSLGISLKADGNASPTGFCCIRSCC